MSSKMSLVKTGVVLVILALVGVLGVLGMGTVRTYLSGATGGYEPKEVLPNITENEVVVSWVSDKPSRGYVQYGTTPASLLLSVPSREDLESTSSDTSHRVVIKTFKPNTTYYFRIRAGDSVESYTEWEVFDNGGIPYSFKTKGGDVTTSGTDVPVTKITPVITVVPIPTVVSSSSTVSGTGVGSTSVVTPSCQTGKDYNVDGVVNSIDMRYCMTNGSGSVATASGQQSNKCQSGVDYNKDGVVNSMDMIKCRQN